MITKFESIVNDRDVIEFKRVGENLHIHGFIRDDESVFEHWMSKDDLFDLIGQLLRIQSEIRKEGSV